MQTLPEATPRKEPTEIIGSLFAVVVVISLNYPRAPQYSRAHTLQAESSSYLYFVRKIIQHLTPKSKRA